MILTHWKYNSSVSWKLCHHTVGVQNRFFTNMELKDQENKHTAAGKLEQMQKIKGVCKWHDT